MKRLLSILLLVAPSAWACDLGDRVPVSIDGKEVRIDRWAQPDQQRLQFERMGREMQQRRVAQMPDKSP